MENEYYLDGKRDFKDDSYPYVEKVNNFFSDVCQADIEVNGLLDSINNLSLSSDRREKLTLPHNLCNITTESRAPIPTEFAHKHVSTEVINEVYEKFYKMDIMYKRLHRKVEEFIRLTLPQYLQHQIENSLKPLEQENLRLKTELLRHLKPEVKSQFTQTNTESTQILSKTNIKNQLNEDEEYFREFPTFLLQEPTRTRFFGNFKKVKSTFKLTNES
ncbi:unnamed protein product [Dimorphilus gyrociliatus]|uniref:Uncharacterized protein n=1 Tax=Dimorphilus gyrociliatus TaxID=2664684 RepID=A0A7I8W7U6_9ANNE|nr:unnamed protein product [Dimorphilus gyrociliatus]